MEKKRGAGCTLAKGFSLSEKLYAQISFNVMCFVGVVGIAREDWLWSIPYLLIFGYGVPGIVMRHLVCPRCPHLYGYGDCLQFPPKWTKWLVKRQKTTPLTAGERWQFLSIFLLIPTFPLYWLSRQPILLAVFCLAAVTWYAGQWLYFCKRCRVKQCPFNRATAVE